ncbi:MAG: Crp/Fnr family transcriptional regulator [Pseudomonadota bacterium]
MASIGDWLRTTLWARALTPEQFRRVEAETIVRSHPAGSYVCRKGEPVDYWYGVIEGLLKMHAESPEGKAVTFTGMPTGGWFGEGSLLKNEPRRYDVVALRDSRVACMPRATFEWLLDTSIGFNRFLLHQLNERLGYFIAIVEYDRLLGPDERVARCLANLFNPYLNPGLERELQLSQEEIGFLSGLSRQRANQALQVLEKAGILRVEYGRITILDLEALRRFTSAG